VALTFTRKAAGEFFDEILKKLARAAASEDAAYKLAHDVRAPALKAADFCGCCGRWWRRCRG
jgi:ATP-dependent exoDNAse (exonuclease V) beta subunit